jgi:hypothetical protein
VDVEAVVGAARVHAAALADSGAIHGSYISTSMSELLRKKGVSMEHKTQRVCSFNKVCTTVSSGYGSRMHHFILSSFYVIFYAKYSLLLFLFLH